MSEARFRVWRVELKDCTERINLKPPKTEKELRELFNIPDYAKVTSVIDKRMKDGGKS